MYVYAWLKPGTFVKFFVCLIFVECIGHFMVCWWNTRIDFSLIWHHVAIQSESPSIVEDVFSLCMRICILLFCWFFFICCKVVLKRSTCKKNKRGSKTRKKWFDGDLFKMRQNLISYGKIYSKYHKDPIIRGNYYKKI